MGVSDWGPENSNRIRLISDRILHPRISFLESDRAQFSLGEVQGPARGG